MPWFRLTKKKALSLVGAIVLGLLIVMNVVGQALYAQTEYANIGYSSYFYLVWFTESFLPFSLPLFMTLEAPVRIIRGVVKSEESDRKFKHSVSAYFRFVRESFENLGRSRKSDHRKNIFLLIGCFILMAILNFGSSYTWYWSLAFITISANMALYSTVAPFLFLIGVVVRTERFKLSKCLATMMCFAGAIMLFFESDGDASDVERHDWIIGCFLIILSALLYAAYETLYQFAVGRSNPHIVLLSQTCMGIFVFSVLWIPIIPLTKLGIEPRVTLVGHPDVTSFMFVNVGFAVSYYLLFAFGITLGKPIYVTVVSLLNIPVGAIVDKYVSDITHTAIGTAGLVCMSAATLVIAITIFDDAFERVAKRGIGNVRGFFHLAAPDGTFNVEPTQHADVAENSVPEEAPELVVVPEESS